MMPSSIQSKGKSPHRFLLSLSQGKPLCILLLGESDLYGGEDLLIRLLGAEMTHLAMLQPV